MKTINSFNQIEIIPNSLVVFDIDETLIKFDGIDFKWWKNKFNKYYKMTHNNNLADKLANQDWIKIIQMVQPELVDEQIHQFIQQLREANCEIILLTARNEIIRELTLQHLSGLNFNFDSNKIFFNENKGDELLKLSNQWSGRFSNIIVVDDIKQNLEDIKNKMNGFGVNLQLYNIQLYNIQ